MKRLIIVLAVAAVFMFSLAVSAVMAQDYCEGNFDNDLDQDGSDAFVFKADFGRSSLLDPCPVIACQTAEELEIRVVQLETLLAQVTALLENVTRVGNDITFSGVNVQITNGLGGTQTANGLGNLIVGYNEIRGEVPDIRTGSHNIVVGAAQSYSSYGGLIAGYYNTIAGPYASVIGGRSNQAFGDFSFVGGGGSANPEFGNWAVANYSAILGGTVNTTGDSSLVDNSIGIYSTVSGGSYNNPISESASVSGGYANRASGKNASVSGGGHNEASGDYSFVGGGGAGASTSGNTAFAHYSAVLGGTDNVAGDPDLTDHSIGEGSSVNGGWSNKASGNWASVSGGNSNTASGYYSSVSGGDFNSASGTRASVSGGFSNTASGSSSSVSGGFVRSATSNSDWAAGALWQDQ